MLALAQVTTVWPHPEELLISGAKLRDCETIRVASLSMGLSTPMYAIADDLVWSDSFQKKLREGTIQGVLKRDYSMRGDHVITPQTPDRIEKLNLALKTQRTTWGSVKDFFSQPCWFVQPFLAHLLYIGEVRVVIVGGRIAYKMSTTPRLGDEYGEWETTDKPFIRPIHKHT